jgi:hypothetical protein
MLIKFQKYVWLFYIKKIHRYIKNICMDSKNYISKDIYIYIVYSIYSRFCTHIYKQPLKKESKFKSTLVYEIRIT